MRNYTTYRRVRQILSLTKEFLAIILLNLIIASKISAQ